MAATERLMQELYEYVELPVDYEHAEQVSSTAGSFRITNQSQAIWALRKMTKMERRRAEAKATALDEIDRISKWLTDIEEKTQGQLAYFEALLRDYFIREQQADPKLKSIKLPHGTLKMRKQQPEYSFDDEQIIAWAKDNLPEAIQIKEALLKIPVKEYIKETGEVIPGVTVSIRPDKFSVELEVG